jgi:hypothetical protein
MPSPSWSLRLALVAALVANSAHRAAALVVAPASTNNNTSAPIDDPGWLNVGNRGVYIGNRWVLTAFHVNAGTTTFNGVGTFAAVPGSAIRLNNPTGLGLTAQTDLVMYRLTTDPGLPALSIAPTTAPIGGNVVLIGSGASVTPSTGETHWNVTGSSPNYTWTETPTGTSAHGYKSNQTGVKLWGANIVENDDAFFAETDVDAPNHTVEANSGFGDVISLVTEFDKTGLTGGLTNNSEAQALSGDSGSGVFYKDGANWTLAGITHAIAGFEDQPSLGTTAVFGNLTFFADLSRYRDQILAIAAVPEATSLLCVGGAALFAGTIGAIRRRRQASRTPA